MQSQATTHARPRALRVLPAPADVEVPRARRLRAGTVSRPRLVRPLATATDAALVALVAPVGYGKTTLLCEWEARDPRPFAWVTLTEDDNDPARLLAVMAARLGDDTRPTVLVLDDLQVLRSERALDAIAVVADRLRPGCVVAVASRAEPELPLARLRAQGALVELREDDLAMSGREAASLLRRAGLRLGAADVETIVSRTEGWPAGLYLAALSLLAQDDRRAAIARFAGDDRIVADYLREELLSSLDSDERAFLTRTSLLDELSGPLCDAVLGRRRSSRMLRHLARSNVLLQPLDRAERRFREHPLLADMLRAELRRDEPEREPEIHRRASAWHEREGDPGRAFDHAAAAGDTERAGALLWSAAGALLTAGRPDGIDARLGRFTDAEVARHPSLALTAALHACAAGRCDEAIRWVDAAERALGDAAADDAGLALLRAMIAREGITRMTADAARAHLLDDDARRRARARLLEGVGHHLSGARERGLSELEDGARRAGHEAAPVQALCLAQLALAALELGDWDQGATLADRALDAAPPSALALAVAAFASSHRGRIDEARAAAAQARRRLPRLGGYAPWYGAEVRIALARAELRLSNAAGARALLAEASRDLRRARDAVVLQRWIDDGWARADTFAAAAVAGPSALTTAELRVLRFLPSHLSFREIAARLHVSANTVKTQAHAVYRKLDSSSRSEAVARARDVGLIDKGLGDREAV